MDGVSARERSKPTDASRHADDLRAAAKLAVAATRSVTSIVEDMHRTIASGPALLGKPLAIPARLLTRVVYGHIRAVTGLVGKGVDATLAQAGPLLGESAPGPEREAVLAALNGVLGDYLKATENPLAITMTLRRNGQSLALDPASLREAIPRVSKDVLVLVHGSSMSDLQWSRLGHDHGAALERDLGLTAIYVRYNTGLHVSTNGRALARLLEELTAAWPVELSSVTLLGHSMGGLVARSACQVAEEEHLAWRTKLRRIATLGTPHHGSPLERTGSVLHGLLEAVAYSAPIARLAEIRSAGVTDLRYGNVLDAHWEGRDRFLRTRDSRSPLPLPAGVEAYAVAGSLSTSPTARPRGDGLVPVDSALGRHRDAAMTLLFPEGHAWVAFGANHLDLLQREDVYARLVSWFSDKGHGRGR
jgi:pimeloyl-ACP methyl ester carboxylesterase